MLEIALWICVALAGLLLLDRLFLWMEAKGWVYYRKVKRKGSGGSALIGIAADMGFDPGAKYLAEAQEERAGKEDQDDGDDDGRRKPEDRLS